MSWNYIGAFGNQWDRAPIDLNLLNKNKRHYIIYQYDGKVKKSDGTNRKVFNAIDRSEFITKHLSNHLGGHQQPGNGFLCEILPEGEPVKMYFDIDFKKSEHPEMVKTLVENDIDVEEWFFTTLKDFCSESPCKFKVCGYFGSDDPTGDKLSAHLVFGFWVGSTASAKMIYKDWIKKFEQRYPETKELFCMDKGKDFESFFDKSVYSRNRGMRMLHSDKTENGKPANRPKKFKGVFTDEDGPIEFLEPEDYKELNQYAYQSTHFYERHILELSLMTHIETCEGNMYELPIDIILNQGEQKKNYASFDLTNDQIDQCMGLLKGHQHLGKYKFSLREVTGTVVSLKNPGGYRCPIHSGKNHEVENPFMYITKNFDVFFNCRRPHKNGDICLGSIVGMIDHSDDINYCSVPNPVTHFKCSDIKQFNEEHVEDYGDIVIIDDAPVVAVKNKTKIDTEGLVGQWLDMITLDPKNIIPGEWVPEIKTGPKTLYIKAPTGRGKTTQLRALIKKYPNLTFCLVSSRTSWSDGACGELTENGIEHIDYRDPETKVGVFTDYKVLVISAESFWRVGKMPDVIVIDEVETAMKSFKNTKMKRDELKESQKLFMSSLKLASFAVVMDANMKQFTIDKIDRIRGEGVIQILKIKHNREIQRVKDYETIKGLIVSHLNNKKKIVVCCAGKSLSNELYHHIKATSKKYDLNLRIKLINSDEGDDREFYKNIKVDVKNLDVVVHTTRLGPGVNIDVPDYFDNMFVLTSSQRGLPCVDDVIQMMGRVREYKDNKIFWAHKQLKCNKVLPMTVEELCRIENSKAEMLKVLKFTEPHWDPVSRIFTRVESLKFWKRLEAEITIERNINIMAFDVLFQAQLQREGYKFTYDRKTYDFKLDEKLINELNAEATLDKEAKGKDLADKVSAQKDKVNISAEKSRDGTASAEDKVVSQIAAIERQFNLEGKNPNELTGVFGYDINVFPKNSLQLFSFIRMVNEEDPSFVYEREVKHCRDPKTDFSALDKPIKYGFIKLALKTLGVEKLEWSGQVDPVKLNELKQIVIDHSAGVKALFGGAAGEKYTEMAAIQKIKAIMTGYLGLNILRDTSRKKVTVKDSNGNTVKDSNGKSKRANVESYSYTMSNDLKFYVEQLGNLKTYREYYSRAYILSDVYVSDPKDKIMDTMTLEDLLSYYEKKQ